MMERKKFASLGLVLGGLLTLSTAAAAQEVMAEVDVPDTYVAGQPFVVEVTYTAGDADVTLQSWQATPAAFELNGEPLADREGGAPLTLPAGSSAALKLNLQTFLEAKTDFSLTLGGVPTDQAFSVQVFEPAPEGLDFLEVPADTLDDYVVLFKTNQGDMLLEMWPDTAPNHVRNFLDLSYAPYGDTGRPFYEGVQFHRVSPSFMIQGGCRFTKPEFEGQGQPGTGDGPRKLQAEFSDKPHERGVLSMARSNDPNSASSQFFVMTEDSPFLDNKYSVFGKLVSGEDALDRIATAPGRAGPDGTVRPAEAQRIEQVLVLKHGGGA